MSEIKFDKRNYRKHNQRNKDLIKKSLEECGAGRSIVIDNNDEIIAGNGIYEQAQVLNIPVKVIETDGSELVVVKRTDLDTDDEKRKKLAVMDNSTSDTSEFDFDLLKEDFKLGELEWFGVDLPPEPKRSVEGLDVKFSANVGTVIYEPKETKWKISDLFEINSDLFDEIDSLKSSEEMKDFLKMRACWLAVLKFDRIADYFANQATKEEQEIFEKLALVLLDKDKLIENGYSDLLKDIDDDCR